MTRSTTSSRSTDAIRVGHAATAGLPSVYRAHSLAREEPFQGFAAQQALAAQVRQAPAVSPVPGTDHTPLRAALIDWLRRQLLQPVVGQALPDDPAVAIQA